MWKTIERVVAPLAAAALAGFVALGCSLGGDEGAADKAGGSKAPVVLRMAYSYKLRDGQPDEPMLRYFADRVAKLSDGELQIRLTFNAAGEAAPDIEARVAKMVRSGRFDLGWVATRVWDLLGVKSFQALQAPFLITDYRLLGRVATSPIAAEMLPGLKRAHLRGLAIVPELLRHPAARRGRLVSVRDFAGARIHDIPSHATDALLRALGATPVLVSNAALDRELAHGRIDGEEIPISRARSSWTVTGNVVFFGKANTVFANPDSLARLTDEQRAVLRRAARDTARHVAEAPPSEPALARRFCSGGRIVVASRSQLAGLRRAARPVYGELERDPLTRSLIARIRRLKRAVPAERGSTAKPCGKVQPTPASWQRPRSPEAFNGTYRWRITKAAAVRAGNPNEPEIGNVVTMTLRSGRWQLGKGPDSGSFSVRGNRLRFHWPATDSVLTFTFTGQPGGTLHLKPVLPMDRGDQSVWAGGPWRRIGPPVERP